MKLNKEYAIEYLNRGWSIIPIKAGTKIPAISSWMKYQTQLPTLAEVEEWWTQFPDASIALVCGKISGVIVVDVDSGKGKPDLTNITLPTTLVANTGGGGKHCIYKWREGLVGAKVAIRFLIDIRSDNSYIVLPPSSHVSGTNYSWYNEGTPIAEAPAWLELTSQVKADTDWNEMFSKKNAEGLRNETAAKMAGKILFETNPELWETLGVGFFRAWNRDFNSPPLPEHELLTVWNSIKKTHIKNNDVPTAKEVHDEKVQETIADGLSNEEEEEQICTLFTKKKIEGTHALAKYIVKRYDIITVGEKARELFLYKNGYYIEGENQVILPEIQRILGDKVNKSAKMETMHKIYDMTSHPRSIFESADLRFIPLRNGVFDRIERKLLPHSPSYCFTYQLPIDYEPSAECPKTLAFFNQVLDEEQMPTIKEWLGYYFYRNYQFKKALIFVGEGDTGKTTLLEVIVHLLGLDNISSVSLQKMSGDKFSAAHLHNKHGNLVDELSARDISDTGNFKVATGGGLVSGEYKFGNQFSFYNFSKFTFACNKIPDVSDFDDEAYFNRWIVIRFGKTIEAKIPNFIKTLTTESERSGLFNYAMEGLDDLLFQGKFTYGKDAMDTKLEMMRSGSSIAMFAAECLVQELGCQITKEGMYEAYTNFCGARKVSSETLKMFGTKIPFYVAYASDGQIQSEGKQVRGWRNVRLLETGEEQGGGDADWGDFN